MEIAGGEKLFPGSNIGIKFKSARRHYDTPNDFSQRLHDVTNLISFPNENSFNINRKLQESPMHIKRKLKKRYEIDGLIHPDDIQMMTKKQRCQSQKKELSSVVKENNSLIDFVRAKQLLFYGAETHQALLKDDGSVVLQLPPLNKISTSAREGPSMYPPSKSSSFNQGTFSRGSPFRKSIDLEGMSSVYSSSKENYQENYVKPERQIIRDLMDGSFKKSSFQDVNPNANGRNVTDYNLENHYKNISTKYPSSSPELSIDCNYREHNFDNYNQPFSAFEVRDTRNRPEYVIHPPNYTYVNEEQPVEEIPSITEIPFCSPQFQHYTTDHNGMTNLQHHYPYRTDHFVPTSSTEAMFNEEEEIDDTFKFNPKLSTKPKYKIKRIDRMTISNTSRSIHNSTTSRESRPCSPDLFESQEIPIVNVASSTTNLKNNNSSKFERTNVQNEDFVLKDSDQRNNNIESFNSDVEQATSPYFVKMRHSKKSINVSLKNMMHVRATEEEIDFHPENWKTGSNLREMFAQQELFERE